MAANDWQKTVVVTDDRLCKGDFLQTPGHMKWKKSDYQLLWK